MADDSFYEDIEMPKYEIKMTSNPVYENHEAKVKKKDSACY